MQWIDATSAADYLRASGRIAAREAADVQELAGGVSNVVLLVSLPQRGERFILKQARDRLRTKDEWLCPPERIWREIDVLEICRQLIAPANCLAHEIHLAVPTLLWQDRANYLYAMTAAPADHQTWKQRLLSGEANPHIAAACGQLLAALHSHSWQNKQIAEQLDDQSYFDQLRLDPYYRQIARVHPGLVPAIERLLDSLRSHPRCLVHGDYSPKNLLVWPGHVLLIDFEVGHFGDPAFDLGFFLTHLALKSIWANGRVPLYRQLANDFWQTYRASLASTIQELELADLEERAVLNLAGCMLARIDGKSPVDYLSFSQQQAVRQLASRWLLHPPASLRAALDVLPMDVL